MTDTDSTCMKLADNGGRFEMEWKALFDLQTLVVISKPPALAIKASANPVNKMAAYLTCTDSTTCSLNSNKNDNLYENPEI